MGHSHSQIPICRYRFRHFFAIYFLILLISTLEGRILSPNADDKKIENEEKLSTLRPQIGSRPPRCEGRCSSCVHCVAIQVPSNPQSRSKIKNTPELSAAAYARDEYNSNYKPMNWKCTWEYPSYISQVMEKPDQEFASKSGLYSTSVRVLGRPYNKRWDRRFTRRIKLSRRLTNAAARRSHPSSLSTILT